MSVATKVVRDYYKGKAQAKPRDDDHALKLMETGDCPRKRVLRAMGYAPTHPMREEGWRTLELTQFWEQWLIDRMMDAGANIERVKVETPCGAGGTIRMAVITDRGQTIEEPVAVYQYAKDLPERRHIDRVMAYLHFWGRHHGVYVGLIHYIHRETGAGPITYTVTYNDDHGAKVEAELAELRRLIDIGEAPQVPLSMSPDSYPCSWGKKENPTRCTHYDYCWGKAKDAVRSVPSAVVGL